MFSKIDLIIDYHYLRVREADILKKKFQTRYEHFEFTMMPFEFMDLMHRVFQPT